MWSTSPRPAAPAGGDAAAQQASGGMRHRAASTLCHYRAVVWLICATVNVVRFKSSRREVADEQVRTRRARRCGWRPGPRSCSFATGISKATVLVSPGSSSTRERLQFAVGPAVGGHDVAATCDLHAGALAGVGEVISARTVSVSAKVPSALLRRRWSVRRMRTSCSSGLRRTRTPDPGGRRTGRRAGRESGCRPTGSWPAWRGKVIGSRPTGCQAKDDFGDSLAATHARVRRPQDGTGAGFGSLTRLANAVLPPR